MKKYNAVKSIMICIAVSIIFIFLILIVSVRSSFREGYKIGQIDAINGKIYYELFEYEDGEREWKKKLTE